MVGAREIRTAEGARNRGAAATNKKAAGTGADVSAAHPKVKREDERLQNVAHMARLAALEQASGRATGWRKGGSRPRHAECGSSSSSTESSRFSLGMVVVGGEEGDGREKMIYFNKKCKADW